MAKPGFDGGAEATAADWMLVMQMVDVFGVFGVGFPWLRGPVRMMVRGA